ncbi:MAG TPA: sigma-70 family RNA polymerase sigma factor [Kofleriaceae bacterium]|nr:sigma-70 family RNA polymerase sigma factor [Kofleriaceae bacterium]
MDADYELLDLWRSGDTNAGQELFGRHFDSVYGFFASKCDGEIDELVQTTFLACVRARDQFRKESSFRTYLFTIARHELYRYLRQRRRDGDRIDFASTSVAELATTPGSRLVRNEDHRRLLDALRRLPVEQQTLLELHYWEDLDISALAEVFAAPAGTIRTRLHRARRALRDRMEETAAAPLEALATLEGFDTWARAMGGRRGASG